MEAALSIGRVRRKITIPVCLSQRARTRRYGHRCDHSAIIPAHNKNEVNLHLGMIIKHERKYT